MDAHAFEALRSEAVASILDRCVARVTGEGALAFLHATTSQDLETLEPGQGALTCLLDERGHVRAELRALVLEGGDVSLDFEPAARDAVFGYLARVAPLSSCEIVDETDRWTITAVRGPRADQVAGAPGDEHAHIEANGVRAIRVGWGLAGVDLFSTEAVPVDARAIDPTDLDAARIAAGRPRFGLDISEDLIVNETSLLQRAVSFTKGCYPGQETVAKIRNLGRPRRALVGLHASIPLRAGMEVEGGVIRSAGQTPQGWVAIALVRAEVATRESVTIGGGEARMRALN